MCLDIDKTLTADSKSFSFVRPGFKNLSLNCAAGFLNSLKLDDSNNGDSTDDKEDDEIEARSVVIFVSYAF